MAENLYPLIYKPGIKRDGSTFQSDYCTSGQWIRFQNGLIRKMGGMKGITIANKNSLIVNPKTVYLYLTGKYIRVLVGGTNAAGKPYIDVFMMDQYCNFVSGGSFPGGPYIDIATDYIWQYEVIVQNKTSYIAYLLSPNESDINVSNTSTCLIFSNLEAPKQESFVGGSQPGASIPGASGLLYASNYLFVYGSNGLVGWSKPNNILDFTNPGARQISVSNDKVIHAKSIRGGLNNPAILFWTLSSVVKCINNPTPLTPPDTLAFQVDILSKSSSILSTRCVVEYDGFFFWPGMDRFFHYNGLVDELPNNMNVNYFFNNLDMAYRQNVFGVKNPKYGEIWWFYPEKLGTPGRPNSVPQGVPTHAIIYNVREKTWYDTAISRTCGMYSDALGIMATYGKPLTNLANDNNYLFRHEFETFENNITAINETYVPNLGDGHYQSSPITSDFTTPTMSWAAFNPLKQFTGADRWMSLTTIEHDFVTRFGVSDMRLTVNTKQYAQDYPITAGPYNLPPPVLLGGNPNTAKVDLGLQGRYISLKFDATTYFEMGQNMLKLGIGDGQ
jgi:hypothetical protein